MLWFYIKQTRPFFHSVNDRSNVCLLLSVALCDIVQIDSVYTFTMKNVSYSFRTSGPGEACACECRPLGDGTLYRGTEQLALVGVHIKALHKIRTQGKKSFEGEY